MESRTWKKIAFIVLLAFLIAAPCVMWFGDLRMGTTTSGAIVAFSLALLAIVVLGLMVFRSRNDAG
jgi:hypothetical protein